MAITLTGSSNTVYVTDKNDGKYQTRGVFFTGRDDVIAGWVDLNNESHLHYVLQGAVVTTNLAIRSRDPYTQREVPVHQSVVIDPTGTVFSADKGLDLDANFSQFILHGTVSAGSSAVDLDGLRWSVQIAGVMTAFSRGLSVSGESANVVIGREGMISAYFAISLVGDQGRIHNLGTVTANGTAVRAEGDDLRLLNAGALTGFAGVEAIGADMIVRNTGSMTGTDAEAIDVTGDKALLINSGIITGKTWFDAHEGRIVNDGLMVGDIFVADHDTFILNRGTITGEVATQGEIDGLTVVNHGTIYGAVNLHGEGSIYRGTGHVDGQVRGGDSDVMMLGGGHDDTFIGNTGDDRLTGRDGDDDLWGQRGDDLLRGGRGDDTLRGSGGSDTLFGGPGKDKLTGGGFRDTFVFQRQNGDDLVTDFLDRIDKIDISAFGLTAADYADVVAPALREAGTASVSLDLEALGGAGHVLFRGAALAEFDAGDFLF